MQLSKKRWFVLVILVVTAALATAFFLRKLAPVAPAAPVVAQEKPKPTGFGFIDVPAGEVSAAPVMKISGWALDSASIAKVEAVLDDTTRFTLKHGIARPDLGAVHPGFPDSAQAGFEGQLDLGPHLSGRHDLRVEVTNTQGKRSVIDKRTVIAGQAHNIWPTQQKPAPEQTFLVLIATSGIKNGGANEIQGIYAPFVSSTMRVGIRVPILYLRTTKGRDKDWAFDPDFDTARKCGDKTLADDSLNQVIDYAVKNNMPVLFTLNGGIWADAQCDSPEWDINDALEQDPANCQWSEGNEVFADDYLKILPGSMNSPELARALSLNIYADKMRHYKKRNLQQAVQVIQKFAAAHPDLFVGINLDPDVYINPFFVVPRHWHDYNPNALRQFREWLSGTGPYAEQRAAGAPDLSAYRRKIPLDLAAVGKLMRRDVKTWDEVDPPREFTAFRENWWHRKWEIFRAWISGKTHKATPESPWFREWELFRRHLVDMHYDDLSTWITEAGIDSRFIFSSQGFVVLEEGSVPFSVRLDGPVKIYDSAGISIEGAVPGRGHLGTILYGNTSINKARLEEPKSLFAAFREFDANWAVIEHNTADFRTPKKLPGFADGYHSMRDLFNYGARFVSPMAWNGSNGLYAGTEGFSAFTSYRNTPLENAVREFLLSHANFPRGGKLWTFGAGNHADSDGWTSEKGQIRPENGAIFLAPEKTGEIVLLSPKELALRLNDKDALVIAGVDKAQLAEAEIHGLESKTGRWTPLYRSDNLSAAAMTPGGIALPLQADKSPEFEQLRVRLKMRPAALDVRLAHIAIYPGR